MIEGTDMIEKVARAKLVDELALAIDQFLSHQIERDTLACDLTQDELTELATGLAAIAAMPVQAEPVAWMYERESDVVLLQERLRGRVLRSFTGWTETPLYAFPTPPAGGSDAE